MSSNLIAQYDTAEGHVEVHGLNGGYTVFVGERMVQKDLNGRDIVCYLCHVLQAVHYRLAKASPDEADQRDAAAIALLRRIREGHMILPSMLARNWEAYALLREVDELLGVKSVPYPTVPCNAPLEKE